jgi:tryptophan synthase alpha chain
VSDRIAERFARLKAENRAALVTFITAGDPNPEVSLSILRGLPKVGADLIELGMPFSDPIGEGAAIQASSHRALTTGATMDGTFELARRFRETDNDTPIILMGYFNPIYVYGVDRFITEALRAGIDGLIVVELPPEEDELLCLPAVHAGLPFIRLATPTTDDERLPKVLSNASGFIYYVSVAGTTGAAAPDPSMVRDAVARIRRHTDLPIGVGFGIRTPKQAAAIAAYADAVVVGSALVEKVGEAETAASASKSVINLARRLAEAVEEARRR